MNRVTATTLSLTILAGLCQPVACATQDDPVQEAYQLRLEGDIDQAKSTIDEEVNAHPDNATAWFELARLEFYRAAKSGEMDTAQESIEKAIALDPENVRYLDWAGRIAVYNFILKAHAQKTAEMLPQMEKATAALEKAVTEDPDCHEARLMLVSCYGNNTPELGGDRTKAEQHVKTLEARAPVIGAEARCEFDSAEAETSLAVFGELARKHVDDARLHENLANLYARTGDVENARTEADRTLKLDPARGHVLLDIGLTFAFDKKLDPAAEFVQRYINHEPKAPVSLLAYAHMVLGRVQKMQGDAKAADATLKKARDIDSYCWFTMRPPPVELFEAP